MCHVPSGALCYFFDFRFLFLFLQLHTLKSERAFEKVPRSCNVRIVTLFSGLYYIL
jgi:hypothetical protein